VSLDVLAGSLRLGVAAWLLTAAARRSAPRLLPGGPRCFSETFLRAVLLATVFIVSSVALLGAAGALGGWTVLAAVAGAAGVATMMGRRRATGATVEENQRNQPALVRVFRERLLPLDAQLAHCDWLLGAFSYADILLLSCVKCFATVLRGVDGVIGADEALPHLRGWYARIHDVCHITDPY